MSIARRLSALGPRFAGTPPCAQAADLIAESCTALGLITERQTFTFDGWVETAPAELRVRGEQTSLVPCATMVRSAAGHAAGHLRAVGRRSVIGVFMWECYEIIDAHGTIAGVIYERDDGPAIPQCLDAPASVPTVVVGHDWRSLLGTGSVEDVYVSLTTHCTFNPGSVSENIIATRPGDPAREILICAHYDSMYGSPGANDNASGVECVLRMAALGETIAPGVTLRFVIFSGEEWLQLGSYAYVHARDRAGDLSAIRLVLNLDMVGRGAYVWASVTDATAHLVGTSMQAVLPEHRLVYHNPHMRGDHYPFHERGIPAIMVLWWPDATYHTPGDVPDRLDPVTLDRALGLAVDVTQRAAQQI